MYSNIRFIKQGHIFSLVPVILSVLMYSYTVYADQITNVRYYHVSDDRIVIYYDLAGAGTSDVSVEVELDGGNGSTIRPGGLSGDVGNAVSRGKYKRIVWDVHKDIDKLPDDFVINVLVAGRLVTAPVIMDEEKTITAYAVDTPIKIDGILNEPSWKDAVPAVGFIQRELVEGAPATERTEVKILYDLDNIYIGVMCYDSEPDNIIHNAMSRDGYLRSDDNFVVVLDTFNDNRNGYYFQTNPNGARFDGTITVGNRWIDEEWNGLWDVAATITENGWSAEMFIPFKTIRFPSMEVQEWGINFVRDIARKREEILWTSWRRDDGIMQLSKAGSLTGLQNIKRGKQVQFKPYTLGGLEYDEGEHGSNLKYGLNVKYPVTTDMTLDLTTFTDFAQVEADRSQINLTRFSLYYPEKREFFLEGAEIFDFGSRFTSPFYSRRIGLTEDSEENMIQVPILGGAKLIGKTGSYNIGVINMQTDKKHEQSSTNYSVVRVKKDIFEQSYIGFIGTNLYNAEKYDSQALGADFSLSTNKFLSNKNFSVGGYVAENRTPGVNHGKRAGRFAVSYPNDLIRFDLLFHVVGENYDPEVGYVRRQGIKQSSVNLRYTPRPGIPYIRKLEFTPIDLDYYTDINNKLLTRSLRVTPLGIDMTTGDEFNFSIEHMYEYIDEEFDIFENIIIPVGNYTWWNYDVRFETNSSRPVSFETGVEWGDFYDGERIELQAECDFKMNRHLSLSTDFQYNTITFGDKNFNTREFGGRFNINASTRLTTSTFVQYENESDEINLNFRLHYIPKIGSDIYLVYNHLWNKRQNYKTIYNTGLSKIAYMITF